MGAGLPHQCEEAPQEAGLKVVARLNTIRLQKCAAMDLHTSDSKCADHETCFSTYLFTQEGKALQ